MNEAQKPAKKKNDVFEPSMSSAGGLKEVKNSSTRS